MTHFMFGLSANTSAAREEMVRQILVDRFPGCTFTCDNSPENIFEDWILPVTIEPHPYDSERVIMVFPDRTLVNDVVEAFRAAITDLSQWKAS